VLRYALDRHAAERPQDTFAVFDSGERWTFAETASGVRAVAAALSGLGVRQGDRVIVMMQNCAASVRALFAINYLGAAFVPINPDYRGALLSHVIEDADAVGAMVHARDLERVLGVSAGLNWIITADAGRPPQPTGAPVVLGASALNGDPAHVPDLDTPIEPWSTQSIIYTSGTTGRSKGVLSSYMHSTSSVSYRTWPGIGPDDRQLLHMPIFHIGGAFIACASLCAGSSIAVVERFKTGTFWETVRVLEVTSVFLLGAMATFLLKAPPRPDDRDHPLRMVFIVPLGQSGPAFRARFDCDVFTLFNMTEISTPLVSGANPAKANCCGRPRDGVDVRLVDANDIEVPAGAVGELIVRTAAPWAMNHGYHNNPEATARAWRNGWFHTGDAFRRDADGDFFFVDRLKDVIRRRGENISSYEIECELLAHPGVREAAAVPVPSEHSEDEVLVVVSAIDGRTLTPEDLIAHLRPRLPHFMIPRYVRIIDELPKTPTAKVQKHVLRHEGLTAECWDRETSER
jgi:crotonobetaine/carnitine-CoA ligase